MAAIDTIPKRLRDAAEQYPENKALLFKGQAKEFEAYTFRELMGRCAALARGLKEIGIERGKHVGIISDNRKEWIISNIALLGIGAVDVPRGSDSTAEEITYILSHAECRVSFVENYKQAEKILSLRERLPQLEQLILFDSSTLPDNPPEGIVYTDFYELYEKGKALLGDDPDFFDQEIDKGDSDDLASLIYTSGTTGEPKGVMLAHRSFTFQLDRIYDYLDIQAGHTLLSVLPIWHSFERSVEYIMLTRGAAVAYSKPIGAVMLPDMQKVQPQWLASVPRIWEGLRAAIYRNINKEGGVKKVLFSLFTAVGESHTSFYNMFTGRQADFLGRKRWLDILISILPLLLLSPLKMLGNLIIFSKIKKKLGGQFIAGISGGGALPPYVDRFFQAAGILLLEGYGLTETGPVLAVRKQNHPVPGTVGPIFPDVQYRIVNKEGLVQPQGKKGVLYVKSEQVMKGYYKRPEASAEVLNDGWLNTGDIAVFTRNREFRILGRAKETIVLLGGENIEPVPIEERLGASTAISQLMLVGQDRKYLGALIVPNMEELRAIAEEQKISYVEEEELLQNPEINEYIHNEIQSIINTKSGFKHFECIYRFKLLKKPFEVGKELTNTQKVRRNIVEKLYRYEIDEIYR